MPRRFLPLLILLIAAAPLAPTLRTRDGGQITLGAPGKWLLVNYWATWCKACREEAPVLAALAHSGKVAVIGLSDENIDTLHWSAFLAEHQIPYRVMLVNDADLPRQIPPSAYFLPLRPISYLIRPDGTVARRFLGALHDGDVEHAMDHSS